MDVDTDPDDPMTVEESEPRPIPKGGLTIYGLSVGANQRIYPGEPEVSDFGLRGCRTIMYARHADEDHEAGAEWPYLIAGNRIYPNGESKIPDDYANAYGIEKGDTIDINVVERIYV